MRNSIILFLFGCLLPTLTFSQNESNSITKKIDSYIKPAFELRLSPGMAVAVVQDSNVIYSKGFGYADVESQRRVTPETMFYIASTTKSFTAFAVALLDHRGTLELDAALSSYLPKLRFQPPLSAEDITLRDLLTHTHGIENGGPVVFRTAYSGEHTNDQLIELLSTYEPASGGRLFKYGNIGYNVASLALDATLEIGWKELLRREIFLPLGMTATIAYMSKVDTLRLAMPYMVEEDGFRRLYYAKSDENMHAAGGHVSTALDLAKWISVHLNSGRLNDTQVFPSEVVAETHRRQVGQDRNFANYHRHGWGLGWDLGTYEADTLIHRFGSYSGFRSHVSFMPNHQIGVVVLVNERSTGSLLADFVASAIYDYLLEKPDPDERYAENLEELKSTAARIKERIAQDRERRAARPQTLPHPLSAYTGVYSNAELGQMEWRLVDEKLEVKMGLLWSPVEVYDADKNKLRVELTGGGEVIEFTIIGDKAQVLNYGGRRFERIED